MHVYIEAYVITIIVEVGITIEIYRLYRLDIVFYQLYNNFTHSSYNHITYIDLTMHSNMANFISIN